MSRNFERCASAWRVALLLCLFAGTGVATAVHGTTVAMVTDLQGKATATRDGQSSSLAILAQLSVGDRVVLAADGTLVTLYLDAGEEYVFKGPATIDFHPSRPEVLSGGAFERRGLSLGNGRASVRIKPVGVTQGAVVMRAAGAGARIQAFRLNRTRTLEIEPEFRWTGLRPGQTYRFELSDESGRTVVEANVERASFKLPASVRLNEGVPYTWSVTAELPDGSKYSASAVFAVAPATVRAEAEALRPAPSSPLSSKVAYAAWLYEMDLRDEARTYWQAALAERPDDAGLNAFARQ